MVDVSVLITCKDKEKYLDECISSVMRQTKKPKEIILVHDECKDPTHHIGVTTIMLRTNLGVCKARNEAFRYSTGKLIVFLDGDDMMSPDYIEKMVLQISNGADISYPDMYMFGDFASELVVTKDDITPALVVELKRVPIPVTSLMKREVYEALGGFKEFSVMEDLDFWLRAMCNGYTFKKAQTLLWYRLGYATRNAMDELKMKGIMAEILAQFTITDTTITKNA